MRVRRLDGCPTSCLAAKLFVASDISRLWTGQTRGGAGPPFALRKAPYSLGYSPFNV
jgi:hypothetical protein